MKVGYSIRKAQLSDSKFLAEAIINAEKSNSDKLSLSTFFNLAEAQVADLIVAMLDEEIEGCEFSIDSYLVAEYSGEPVAAVAGWVEQVSGEMASALLKSNLIGYVFPVESIQYVKERAAFIADLIIERSDKSLQIEYVYVRSEHRGNALAQSLIQEHEKRSKELLPTIEKAQVQLFSNNVGAKKVYRNLGFEVTNTYISPRPDILAYLPHGEKILMEKIF